MNDVITLNPLLLSLLAGAIIPLLVGLATKLSASDGVKAILAIALSALSGAAIAVNNAGGSFHWKEVATAAAITFISGVASYKGVWKPVTDINSKALPEKGLG